MADKAKTISIRIDLQERDYKTKIESLKNEMILLRSEMERDKSEFIGQQNTVDALTRRYSDLDNQMKNLTAQMKVEHDAAEVLNRDLEYTKNALAEANKKYAEYPNAIMRAEEATKKYGDETKELGVKYSEAIDKTKEIKNAIDELNEKYKGNARNFPAYKTQMAELTAEYTKAKEEQDKLGKAFDASSEKSTKAQKDVKKLNNEYEALKKDIESYQNTINDITKRVNNHTAAENRLQAMLNEVKAVLAKVSEALKDAQNNITGTTDKVDNITGEFKEANEAVDALAQSMALQLVEKGFDVVKEAITESIKAFEEYETALAGVSKTTGIDWIDPDTGERGQDIKELGEDFKALSEELPVSAKELLNVAQIAGQLGVRGSEDLRKFTTTMAMLSVSTNLSAEDAATALAQLASVTGMSASEYDKLGSAIVDLGNKYPTSEDVIVRISQRFAAAATSADLSEAAIVGLAAAAGSVGVAVESAGTSLTKLVQKMSDAVVTGNKLDKWAEIAGMSAEEFAELWGKDATGAIAAFEMGIGRLGQNAGLALKEMGINEQRLRDLIMRLGNAEKSSGLLSRALDDANAAFEDGNALMNEANTAYDTLNSHMTIFNNSVENLKSTVGEHLAPQLDSIASAGKNIVNVVDDLIKKDPVLLYGLEAITAVIGVLALKALPEAVPMVGNLVRGFEQLRTVMDLQWKSMFDGVVSGISSLSTVSAASVGSFLTVASAIGAVVAAIALLAYWSAGSGGEHSDGYKGEVEKLTNMYKTKESIESEVIREEQKLNKIRQEYANAVEKGLPTEEIQDRLTRQATKVNQLHDAYDILPHAIDGVTLSEEELSEALEKTSDLVLEQMEAFGKNLEKVKDFSTTYKATATDYIKEIKQQTEWHTKYAENREKLLAKDIDGLKEWLLTWDDGTEEAAKWMYVFGNASDSVIEQAIAQWQELTDAQNENTESKEESVKAYEDEVKAAEDAAKALEEYKQSGIEAFRELADNGIIELGKLKDALDALNGKEIKIHAAFPTFQTTYASAQGLDYVPYDEYPTYLHEGEKVLNRAEASAYRALEKSVTNNTTSNNVVLNVYGTKGQSADEIATVVMNKIQQATDRRIAVWA